MNPVGARFCSACGTALDPGGGRETRKTVTILFVDVTGSTALGERLDPESLRRVMLRYFELAKGCVERHGGTVEKFIGDAVMAVFGVPTVHEDDALRAVRAAADLRDELVGLNVELESGYGVSLRLRTGVNTGEVVTGTEERLATGDAVNVAARLEQAAEPGEILIGETTLRLVRAAVETEAVAPVDAKGKSGRVAAHRLLGVQEGAPGFWRRLDTPLVGRRDHLNRLLAVFENALADRRCHLVTVFGVPGLGKSRLARELESLLVGEATVLSGHCLSYGEGITYWPLVEIFHKAGAGDELAQMLSSGSPEEIFWSVRKAFERRSRERPLALVLDDIHWGEPTLLDLIEHLAQWTRDAPLLLLCLARPELRDERPGWGGELITLEPLSAEESEELIEKLVRATGLDPAARAEVCDAAAGNPLFVEQFLALIAERDGAGVPGTIQALLEARLDALPPAERDVLERASIVGLEFEWETLTALASDLCRPPGALLAALVRKELIRPHENVPDTFQFKHMLIRDAAYERVAMGLRAELHERFADHVDGTAGIDEIVAYHLESAHDLLVQLRPADAHALELATRAAECLRASAWRASARGDRPAAANLLQRACALLPEDDRQRLELLTRVGQLHFQLGQSHEAESSLQEAHALGRASDDRAVTLAAGLELAYIRLFVAPEREVGQKAVWRSVDEAIPYYESTGDEARLARVLEIAGKLLFWQGNTDGAIPHLERAASLAERVGDRNEEDESLAYVLLAWLLGSTPVDQALARIEQLRPRTKRTPTLRLAALEVRAELEAMAGKFDTSRNLLAEARGLANELGSEPALAMLGWRAGSVELLAGDPAAAEREFRPAVAVYERTKNWGILMSLAPRLATALIALGRDDEAFELSELGERLSVPEDVDAQAGWRCIRADILARRGDHSESERFARQAIEIAEPTDYLDLRATATATLGTVLELSGCAKEAATEKAEAAKLWNQKGNVAAVARMQNKRSL